MPRLFVNLDHVATLRQARGTPYPDVLEAALLAERSGFADGITLHLREDRRHVQDRDMRLVSQSLRLPFNFEMSVAADVVELAVQLRPGMATLVPERREELTTEGGLDLRGSGTRVAETVARLRAGGTTVSLFIDPDPDAVRLAARTGAPCVELHTGRYAEAPPGEARRRELAALERAAEQALQLGLIVNAGHGLTVENVPPVARIPGLSDLNIGHSIVSRAVFAGLAEALREMAEAAGSRVS